MERADLVKLVRKAEGGDKNAVATLREEFNRVPAMWDVYRDLARNAETALLNLAAGKNTLAREAWERKAAALRDELAGPDPTPLERILVERAVACWLQVSYADAMAAQNLEGGTLARSDFWRRTQDSAHRRFLGAVKTLAQVRRLALPVLLAQINLAQQQVNVAAQVNTGAPAALPQLAAEPAGLREE